MEDRTEKTDENVKAGLQVQHYHPDDQVNPDTNDTELDADEMVHEQDTAMPDDNASIDPDEAVHQQSNQPIPDPSTETDIDDLMHSPDAGDDMGR